MTHTNQYVIYWDTGFGPTVTITEAATLYEAENTAYQEWRAEVQSNEDYAARPATADDIRAIEEYGEPEWEGEYYFDDDEDEE